VSRFHFSFGLYGNSALDKNKMLFAVSTLLALLPAFISAQTSTLCNPTEKSCPADPGFPATTVYNFQQSGLDDTWDVLGSANMISQDGNGLHFTIDASGQAPTITTKRKTCRMNSMLISRVRLFRNNYCHSRGCGRTWNCLGVYLAIGRSGRNRLGMARRRYS
jgi:hypothetical protein